MAKVVFIMTDTQRYDMVNVNVKTGLTTPCLDELANSGMRFSQAYTTQPVCQPARAGLFTGLYPHSCNCWTNSSGMPQDVKSIGQRLQDKGVHTAYVGKWHLDGGDYFGLGKCPEGWDADYWYDMRNYLDELTPEERLLSRQDYNMLKQDFPAQFTFAHRCSDRAIDFLSKNADKDDFFLVVSYDEPHHPYICPREFWQKYEGYKFPCNENVKDTLENKPDYQKAWAGERLSEDRSSAEVEAAFYFGSNSFVDDEIGRVLKAVKQYAGEDTYIIYTSDHGDFLQSHRLTGKGPAVYEEIAHIPMFMAGKNIPANSVLDAPVSHIDITPTVLDLFGIEKPVIMPGNSLLQAATQQGEPASKYAFIEFGRYEVDHDGFGGFQPLRAAFDGRFKLSINLMSQDEFYDLKNDPSELVNEINNPEFYDDICRIHDAILENMNVTRDPFRGYYWERRPWRKDARAATWEYTGYTRQSEYDYEPRQLDYDTGLAMENATRTKIILSK